MAVGSALTASKSLQRLASLERGNASSDCAWWRRLAHNMQGVPFLGSVWRRKSLHGPLMATSAQRACARSTL